MKEPTKSTVPRSILLGLQICFSRAGYHAPGHDLNVEEGEKVARGHFHERVGEILVHWLPPGVGFTPKPFSVSENGPFQNFLRSNSTFIL